MRYILILQSRSAICTNSKKQRTEKEAENSHTSTEECYGSNWNVLAKYDSQIWDYIIRYWMVSDTSFSFMSPLAHHHLFPCWSEECQGLSTFISLNNILVELMSQWQQDLWLEISIWCIEKKRKKNQHGIATLFSRIVLESKEFPPFLGNLIWKKMQNNLIYSGCNQKKLLLKSLKKQ